jgi:hypothetical protein
MKLDPGFYTKLGGVRLPSALWVVVLAAIVIAIDFYFGTTNAALASALIGVIFAVAKAYGIDTNEVIEIIDEAQGTAAATARGADSPQPSPTARAVVSRAVPAGKRWRRALIG